MKLMVLDGNSILNRAYYGIRPLSTREGLYTHAVYGFITTLQRLLDEENPEALCVTFDRREPTFRHRADAEYKAQRKPMPPELAMQLPVMKQVLSAMSVPCYELAGYEADDLIGTISRKCQAAGWDCVIVTGDKDSLQLITDRTKVKLVSTRMGQTTTKDMTPETFREQYGFDPIHMIDLKALMGDTSDNIPGVPGVGEKTAMALVQEYGTIDEIYRLLPDLHAKPAAIRKLTEGEESARHSYWLATIVTDAPLDFDPAENLRRPFRPELYDLFLRLEFQKLIDKYHLRPHQETAERPEVTAAVVPVRTEDQARDLLAQWRQAEAVTVYAVPDLSALSVRWDAGENASWAAELWTGDYQGDWQALLAALFAWVLGLGTGIIAAIRQNSLVDHLFMGVSLAGVSMPIFMVALLLQYLFAFKIKAFPLTLDGTFLSMILPAIALGWNSAGSIARMTRSSLLEVMQADYIDTARAKGLRKQAVILGHALKNSMLPVITMMALQFSGMLSGAVITESIFAIPGIGRLATTAIQNRDMPVLQGTVLFTTVLVIAGNLIADLLYSVLDPRIRKEA